MSFALQVQDFAKAVKVRSDVVLQKISLEVFKSVVLRTPVDTGRARGNWLLTIGTPAKSTVDRKDKAGSLTIQSAVVAAKKANSEQSVYITNNVSYIKALENGKSKQAPSGMVAVTMASIEAYMAKVIKEAKHE